MSTLLTRWTFVIDLPEGIDIPLSTIFNEKTGKSFIRELGGRSKLEFSPRTLDPTTRFYDLLRTSRLAQGFSGRKFPFEHITRKVRLNATFHRYGKHLLAINVTRAAMPITASTDLLAVTSIQDDIDIRKLVLSVVGLVADPQKHFKSATKFPKAYLSNLIDSEDINFIDNRKLVELLTRHESPSDLVMHAVMHKNRNLQVDSGSLLVDRQGVVAFAAGSAGVRKAVKRRFVAAQNMIELAACVERLLERDALNEVGSAITDLSSYFREDGGRFTYSTSSRHLWEILKSEFNLTSARWSEAFEGIARVTNDSAELETELSSHRAGNRTVLLLHGIESYGKWQKDVAGPLAKARFVPEALDYGKFSIFPFLLPWRRKAKVDWFCTQYFIKAQESRTTPHLIAHSFGTYIVAEAMSKFPEIRFDSIVFVGSIVRTDYPWGVFFDSGQVRRVLNESGGRDIVVRLAEWIAYAAGPSGALGFEFSSPNLIENHNPKFSHSDAFYRARFESTWIPFLRGERIKTFVAGGSRRRNWKYSMVIVGLVVLLFLLFWYFVSADAAA